jgi:cellulose synthase/poly-beta-1,6-N-acetylglucosamine synthase-like glycosyltransferase
LKIIIGLLLFFPSVYVLAVSCYFLILTLGALLYSSPRGNQSNSFSLAILVPAHNEEEQIESIIRSIQNLTGTSTSVETFVIADNCDDSTVHVARTAGATVFERKDLNNPGKGQALDWCLKNHQDQLKIFDAIAFVDADMTITPNFADELALCFADPKVNIVQTLNIVSNPTTNWRCAIGFMSFAVINHLRPSGRCWLGGTAELKGSGMAFRSHLILDYGWPAHTIAEDSEFAKQLLADGHRVHYTPHAQVRSPIPEHKIQIETQQSRWEGGKQSLFKKYFPIFLKKSFSDHPIQYIDATMDLLVPPLTVLIAVTGLCFVGSLLVSWLWGLAMLICLAVIGLAILTSLLQLRAPLKVYGFIAAIPVFMLWKIPLLFRVTFGKSDAGWERTPRDNELDE